MKLNEENKKLVREYYKESWYDPNSNLPYPDTLTEREMRIISSSLGFAGWMINYHMDAVKEELRTVLDSLLPRNKESEDTPGNHKQN